MNAMEKHKVGKQDRACHEGRLHLKVTFEVREKIIKVARGRVLQEEGRTNTKILRWEFAWHI